MTDKTAIDVPRGIAEAMYKAIGEAHSYLFRTSESAWDIKALEKQIHDSFRDYENWKALAAIDAEKPGDDAESCLSKMFRDIRQIGYITEPLRLTNESHDACISLLQHFAESYHATRIPAIQLATLEKVIALIRTHYIEKDESELTESDNGYIGAIADIDYSVHKMIEVIKDAKNDKPAKP